MRELSLFTGAGGGVLASKLLNWKTKGYVEYNDYCQQTIAQRIKDGLFDEAPIFSDIRAFVSEGFAESYSGMVDVISAGFPCQPFSVAGNRQGEADNRNMWPPTLDCIRQIRPTFAFLENVPGLTHSEKLTIVHLEKRRQQCLFGEDISQQGTRYYERRIQKIIGRSYFGRILSDLAESGFDAKWRLLSAAECGAPHKRDRVWIVATNAGGQ